MDIKNATDIDRLVKHTPVYAGKVVTLNSIVVDEATGERGKIFIRPHNVTEVANILSRYPQLKRMFGIGVGGGDYIDWVDAISLAGIPALCALIAQNVGRYRDAEFEAWLARLPDEDFVEILAAWREVTMPNGVTDFLRRLVGYLQKMGMPAAPAEEIMRNLETISAAISEGLSNLAASARSSTSTDESPSTQAEADSPTIPSPDSSPSLSNSILQDVEQIPG